MFGFKGLEKNPTLSTPAPHELFKTAHDAEQEFIEVMERLRIFSKHHGSDVKSWFKDFDKHHNGPLLYFSLGWSNPKPGIITKNQFKRGIPQNLLSQSEEDTLIEHYTDPLTGNVNYFKMNNDANRKVRKNYSTNQQLVAKPIDEEHVYDHIPIGTEELLISSVIHHHQMLNDANHILEHIKKSTPF